MSNKGSYRHNTIIVPISLYYNSHVIRISDLLDYYWPGWQYMGVSIWADLWHEFGLMNTDMS